VIAAALPAGVPLPAGAALPPAAALAAVEGNGVPVAAGVHAAATAVTALSCRNRRRVICCRMTSSM
jgi:hypothetical protein